MHESQEILHTLRTELDEKDIGYRLGNNQIYDCDTLAIYLPERLYPEQGKIPSEPSIYNALFDSLLKGHERGLEVIKKGSIERYILDIDEMLDISSLERDPVMAGQYVAEEGFISGANIKEPKHGMFVLRNHCHFERGEMFRIDDVYLRFARAYIETEPRIYLTLVPNEDVATAILEGTKKDQTKMKVSDIELIQDIRSGKKGDRHIRNLRREVDEYIKYISLNKDR